MTEPDQRPSTTAYPTDAEQALVGVLMYSPGVLGDVLAAGVTPAAFYRPLHRDIMQAILDLDGAAVEPDPVAVADQMSRNGSNTDGRVAEALFAITQRAVAPQSATYYADKVMEGAMRRHAQHVGITLQQYATDDAVPVKDTLDRAAGALEQVESKDQRQQAERFGDVIDRALAPIDYGTFINSGFPSLDEVTGGFLAGQMVIVAARPGVGKSTIALDMARHVAKTTGPVIYFSLEMSKEEVVSRALAAECGVDLKRLLHRQSTQAERQALADLPPETEKMPLLVDTTPGCTVTEIRSKARKQARTAAGLRMIVVDYVGLLRSVGRVENRQTEIADFSRALKVLALELQVPVIVVAQLSRAAEDSETPTLRHLRESGALEQDADKVLMLQQNRDLGTATVHVVKNRAGELGEVSLTPQLYRARFTDPGPEAQWRH